MSAGWREYRPEMGSVVRTRRDPDLSAEHTILGVSLEQEWPELVGKPESASMVQTHGFDVEIRSGQQALTADRGINRWIFRTVVVVRQIRLQRRTKLAVRIRERDEGPRVEGGKPLACTDIDRVHLACAPIRLDAINTQDDVGGISL